MQKYVSQYAATEFALSNYCRTTYTAPYRMAKIYCNINQFNASVQYFTAILQNRVGYHPIDSLWGAERQVCYRQVISYETEEDNCIIT